jgi:glucose-6-phosphate isomerase
MKIGTFIPHLLIFNREKRMKQAQSQKPHWWINNLTPAAVKNEVCQQSQIRGCIVDMQNVADAIAYTNEFDQLLNENLDAPTGAAFQKVMLNAAQTFVAQPGGWVSIPFLPVILNDQKDVENGLAVLGVDLNQQHTLLQLSAVPENIAFAAELIRMGYSLNFSDVLIKDQIQRIIAAYIAGLQARQIDNLDINQSQLFLSVPVNTDEISNIAQVGREHCTEAEIDYMQKLYAWFSTMLSSDEMTALVGAGAHKPEIIWTDVLPADGANADTYYIEMLDGDANFEANVHLICRSTQAGISTTEAISSPCNDGDIPAFSEEHIESFYERRKKAADAAWRKAIRLVREKSGELAADKKSFGLFNAEKVGIDATVNDILEKNLVARIWQHDHTVWRSDPKEISNRLGWLHCPQRMLQNVKYLESFVAEIVLTNQFSHVVLCGMGGSSLAPEVFQKTFGTKQGYLEVLVLDSTDPWAMHHVDDTIDLEKTLFIVSTKSGGTVETTSMMKYYYHRLAAKVGTERAGQNFVLITDPGSSLIAVAAKFGFRRVFLNDPNIGGRYSALSYFGLLPASLTGIDVRSLLEIAQGMAVHLSQMPAQADNLGVQLGAMLGKGALSGKDKLTFILSPAIENFGAWVEQLIAESTGKEGKGILPVVGEKVLSPQYYQDDRLFVYMHVGEDRTNESAVLNLIKAGFPVIDIHMDTILELGAQFLLWEFATAVASAVMDIQPFDQPSVESAKVLARKMVAEYKESGSLTTEKPIFQQQDISVFGCCEGNTLSEILTTYLGQLKGNKYCAIQAYLPPSEDVHTSLADMQTRIHSNKHCAVTVGIGPRYLHSTGQLHKGDAGNGVFLQITSDPVIDLQIPDEMDVSESSISFGILKMAQALGDQEALRSVGRSVLHVHLGKDVYSGLKQILLSLAKLQ